VWDIDTNMNMKVTVIVIIIIGAAGHRKGLPCVTSEIDIWQLEGSNAIDQIKTLEVKWCKKWK
jgi:hypothetical protein